MATITGVPEAISRTAYEGLIESLGLDVDNLMELTFHPQSIEARVLALNEAGNAYANGDEIATHVISIPVEDD